MTGCPRPSGRPPRAVQPSGSRAHPDYTRSFYLLTQLKFPFYLTSLTDALIFPPSSLHGFKPYARLFATDIGDWWSTTLPQVIQIKRFTFYHQATLERGTFAQARLLRRDNSEAQVALAASASQIPCAIAIGNLLHLPPPGAVPSATTTARSAYPLPQH